MDEQEFTASRQAAWQRLAEISERAARLGLKRLPREDVRELGPLYRRAASDLAYARAHAVSASLKAHLNALVARSYVQLYQTDARTWSGFRGFFARDFPRAFRRRLPFFLAAVAFMAVGFVVAYSLVHTAPGHMDIWAPPGSDERRNLEAWTSGEVNRQATDPENSVYASFLMTHNVRVSFLAFALGIAGDVLTALVLFINGANLGAYTAWMERVDMTHVWWPGILPHGVVELTEIGIAGGAGLALGWAVLAPGPWRRRDALVLAALDTVKLVVGGIALLVFAGLVEGFVSHSQLPAWFKLAFGAVSGVAVYGYLLLSGRADGEVEASTAASALSPRGTG